MHRCIIINKALETTLLQSIFTFNKQENSSDAKVTMKSIFLWNTEVFIIKDLSVHMCFHVSLLSLILINFPSLLQHLFSSLKMRLLEPATCH